MLKEFVHVRKGGALEVKMARKIGAEDIQSTAHFGGRGDGWSEQKTIVVVGVGDWTKRRLLGSYIWIY